MDIEIHRHKIIGHVGVTGRPSRGYLDRAAGLVQGKLLSLYQEYSTYREG